MYLRYVSPFPLLFPPPLTIAIDRKWVYCYPEPDLKPQRKRGGPNPPPPTKEMMKSHPAGS
jgi:hypothetical protein